MESAKDAALAVHCCWRCGAECDGVFAAISGSGGQDLSQFNCGKEPAATLAAFAATLDADPASELIESVRLMATKAL